MVPARNDAPVLTLRLQPRMTALIMALNTDHRLAPTQGGILLLPQVWVEMRKIEVRTPRESQ